MIIAVACLNVGHPGCTLRNNSTPNEVEGSLEAREEK